MRLFFRIYLAVMALSAFQCSLLPAMAEVPLPDSALPIAHKALRTLPEILARIDHEGWSPEEFTLAQLLLKQEKYFSQIKLSVFDSAGGRRWLMFPDADAYTMSISNSAIHDSTGAPLPFHMVLSVMLKAVTLSPQVWPLLVENHIGYRTVTGLAERLECLSLLHKTPPQQGQLN